MAYTEYLIVGAVVVVSLAVVALMMTLRVRQVLWRSSAWMKPAG